MSEGKAVTKAEFAALCRVDKTRVSHWIRDGKLKGKALVGEGRNAKIDVEEAQRQLRVTLDSGQRLGNGLGTRLDRKPAPTVEREVIDADPGATDPEDVLDDALDAEIKREKLVQLQRANRKGAEDEAAAQGRYTETLAARRQMSVVAVQTMRVFEGAVPEMATTLASRFSLEEREVLQFLSEFFRTLRVQAAEKARQNAETLPTLVPAEA